jgi:hypothetical protein
VNHENRSVVDAVEVHCGDSAENRGSAACCTVHPDLSPSFIDLFEIGDTGELAIIDKTLSKEMAV